MCYNPPMQVVLIILSVGLLGVIIYFAISPKSSRLLKISALIALGLIAVSIGVCGVFLIRGPGKSQTAVPLPFIVDDSQPVKKSNAPMILSFAVVFLFILGLTAYLTMKERKNLADKGKKAPGPSAFKASIPQKNESAVQEEQISINDDSFDIGLD